MNTFSHYWVSTMWSATRQWAAMLLLIVSLDAFPHEMRPALLNITQVSEQDYEVTFRQPIIQDRFLNLAVQSNCSENLNRTVRSRTLLEESFSWQCEGALEHVRIQGLENTLIDTMVIIETLSAESTSYLLNGRNPVLQLTSGASVPAYLLLGIEHLIFGIDHVFFVLLLLFFVTGFRQLIVVITSFTVAHSITLGLSAFDLVTVSQPPVEALIALSIVLLAAEALRKTPSRLERYPWVVAFVFGLLHGMGFAGALADIGLPQDSAIMALFLFNVGIELGQLGIVAIAFFITWLVSQTVSIPWRRLAILPVYLIGGVSTYWFIDRTLQVVN